MEKVGFGIFVCQSKSYSFTYYFILIVPFSLQEPYLAQVLTALISQDITEKLFVMNQRIHTEDGKNLDIRLPGIAGRLCQMDNRELTLLRNSQL